MNRHIRELESSKQRNEAFIRALPDLCFVITRDGLYLDSHAPNPALLRAPANGLIGRRITEIFEPCLVEKFMVAVGEVLATGGIQEIDYELDVPAGHRWFECRIVALDAETALYIARDVTARHLHEAEILSSLREKEVLLREIHHRVKNNLQVISSLVSLQTDLFSSPTDRHLMQETQQRIQSMAQLHELLYQSTDFLSIDLNEYLGGILDELVIEYNAISTRLRIGKMIPRICVTLEVALPIGLIVNELVTNALKYAFPDNRTGSVALSAEKIGESIRLSVIDDGVGLPAEVTVEKAQSLGFLLVRSLTEQLRGSIIRVDRPGTALQLTFPAQMHPCPAVTPLA